MYQRMGGAAYKADLNNTLLLAEYLDNPHYHFKSVHVAGTNGKGSTSHMLASIFQEAGYKTGLYTSPHLKDFRERIRINGQMISEDCVQSFVNEHRSFFETNQLSFFEMTVGMAFDHFRREQVDIAIVEVGMGGRLDSTNIITPEVSIITNIGLDHTRFLGDTLKEIAGEKAGIIKKDVPVVVGECHPETEQVFRNVASRHNSELTIVEPYEITPYTTDLKGNYQKHNLKTVIAAVKILLEKGWKLSESAIKNGLENVIRNTGLMGRWQTLRESPKVICDTAHNKEGLMYVLEQIEVQHYNNLHIVLGMVNDKDPENVLRLFPKDAQYYFCSPNIPRGLPVEILNQAATQFNLSGSSFKSVSEAYKSAINKADKADLIFVGGSTFVVAEVL
ncbi:bifunctional dihydrofolate synthase / folylpolyglutamate synthase [Constantimarinum furrinae]|uniref:Dihydrofolate synthase/folylpolyglutamate synthase n=2 Tax=Constantimarinum furrinae TaxID=2562285 RepID=A0A7G8PUH2_9FLAO|nr:bifunctional dihydrofolate synthase / folylpolyglutamate synthase [Constantimarinum furrinae]